MNSIGYEVVHLYKQGYQHWTQCYSLFIVSAFLAGSSIYMQIVTYMDLRTQYLHEHRTDFVVTTSHQVHVPGTHLSNQPSYIWALGDRVSRHNFHL